MKLDAFTIFVLIKLLAMSHTSPEIEQQESFGSSEDSPIRQTDPNTEHRAHKLINSGNTVSIFEQHCLKYAITEREKQIIFLTFAKSLESREIAAKLAISPRTVENHFANIYSKTGVHNKLSLIHRMFFSAN